MMKQYEFIPNMKYELNTIYHDCLLHSTKENAP